MTKEYQIELVYKAFIKILVPLEVNRKRLGAYILKKDKEILVALEKIEVLCKIVEQAIGIGNSKQALRYIIILEKEVKMLEMNL